MTHFHGFIQVNCKKEVKVAQMTHFQGFIQVNCKKRSESGV